MGYANRGPQGCPSPQAVDTVLSRRTDAQTKVYHSRGNQLKTNVVPFVAALFAILLLAAVPASAQTDLVTCGPTSYPKFCHSFQISPGFTLISGWASASSPQKSSGGISVMCSNFSAAIYVPCNPATQTVSFSTGPVSQSITYDMVIYMSSCTYLYSGDAGTVIHQPCNKHSRSMDARYSLPTHPGTGRSRFLQDNQLQLHKRLWRKHRSVGYVNQLCAHG
jgi:hypothetical protein